MLNKTRILLKQQNVLKKFFFIIPSEDGSIYFGSSFPRPKEMKVGSLSLPDVNNGSFRVNFKDAKDIEPKVSKFSYHSLLTYPSSVIQLKTDEGDIIFKYNVSQLETMTENRKLFVIVPKNPLTYPNFIKRKSQNDIIIPIDYFKGNPFCVDVYLCKKDYDWKQLLPSSGISATGICENKDYRLVIKLYQKSDFKNWPTFTTFLPYVDGIDIKIDSIP